MHVSRILRLSCRSPGGSPAGSAPRRPVSTSGRSLISPGSALAQARSRRQPSSTTTGAGSRSRSAPKCSASSSGCSQRRKRSWPGSGLARNSVPNDPFWLSAGDAPDLPGRISVLSALPARMVSVGTRGVAISLFSGAGGLDLGSEQAGYEVRAAVEWDRDAAATMEKNFSHLVSPVIQADILAMPTREILAAAGLERGQRPDLLIGGPPCTPFSKSGFWLEWKRDGLDPDASLLQAYTRVLAEARPRRFVLENVYALTYNNKASRPAYERLLREIDAAGYHCKAKVLNAADYGVPQSRPRLFVVGAPKDEPVPDHPQPSHGGQWERRISGDPERPHVT